MSDKLKLCPFCGSYAERNDNLSKSVEGVIGCTKCGAGAFISDWNNRPIEDALQEQIDGMRQRLQTVINQICLYQMTFQNDSERDKGVRLGTHAAKEILKSWFPELNEEKK